MRLKPGPLLHHPHCHWLLLPPVSDSSCFPFSSLPYTIPLVHQGVDQFYRETLCITAIVMPFNRALSQVATLPLLLNIHSTPTPVAGTANVSRAMSLRWGKSET